MKGIISMMFFAKTILSQSPLHISKNPIPFSPSPSFLWLSCRLSKEFQKREAAVNSVSVVKTEFGGKQIIQMPRTEPSSMVYFLALRSSLDEGASDGGGSVYPSPKTDGDGDAELEATGNRKRTYHQRSSTYDLSSLLLLGLCLIVRRNVSSIITSFARFRGGFSGCFLCLRAPAIRWLLRSSAAVCWLMDAEWPS